MQKVPSKKPRLIKTHLKSCRQLAEILFHMKKFHANQLAEIFTIFGWVNTTLMYSSTVIGPVDCSKQNHNSLIYQWG